MLAWLLAGALGIGWHVGDKEIRKFESIGANEIRSQLSGENAVVDVKAKLFGPLSGIFGDLKSVAITASNFQTEGLPLFTEPERSKAGYIQELRINLTNFSLSKLRVASLQATIPDCRYDFALAKSKQMIRLSQSGVGTGTVTITAKDLEAFILRKYAEIKTVSVKIERGKVFVEGYGEFIIAKSNFLVIATLGVEDGVKLNLEHPRILFDGRRPDEASANLLIDSLNPVVDLDKDLNLHGAVYVESIILGDNELKATGKTRIPDRPKN